MAADASQALGASEIAGTFVMPKGSTKLAGAGAIGGAIGAAAAGAVASRSKGGAPRFGRVGYVALTESEIAIVKAKTLIFRPKIGTEVVSRAPRSEIASSELDGKLLKAKMRIDFTDGGTWEFEVPKVYRKTAEKVISALGGNLH